MRVKKMMLAALTAASLSIGVAACATACGGKKTDVVVPAEGPETGVYYYDAAGDEYLITLNNADKVAFAVNGANKSGTYVLDGSTLKFTFYGENGDPLTATYAEGEITLTFGGETMRFLKKIKYTVSFDVAGGSEVSPVSVVNGRTVQKPADPVREGYVFLGWYTAKENGEAFAFGSLPITADTTVYARWESAGQTVVGQAEYAVFFELGYAGAENPASVKTVGGKLLSLPEEPVRDGYRFVGWWVSMSDKANELTCRYSEDTVFGENATLFAVWRSATASAKLPEPAVSVYSDRIEWNSVAGARTYRVSIEDGKGNTVLEPESVGSYTKQFDFSKLPAGDYFVKVTAVAESGEANDSDTALRLYKNRALKRVSLFEVAEPSTLIFNSVANAENYYVTLECGSEGHVHELVYNGSSTTFGFADCTVGAEGFKFTVRATAVGYADSVSRTFVYNRALDRIEELVYDAEKETFAWNGVAKASEYLVTVTCKNADHNHKLVVSNGNKTSFSVKELAPCAAGYEISVLPVTRGYNSPEAAKAEFTKNTLAAPTGLRLIGQTLSWTAVDGATGGYEVRVGGIVIPVTEGTSLALTDSRLNWQDGDYGTAEVRALGTVDSLWSDPLEVRYNKMFDALSYKKGVLNWGAVLNADSYEYRVNGGQAVSVTDTSAAVSLRAGENTLEVRFVYGDITSEWVGITVFAHTVSFDVRGGEASVPAQYKATGDPIELPVSEKMGYDFAGWYNVPGGLDVNGAKYTDSVFYGTTDVTLFAYYTPKTYTVTFSDAGQELSDFEVRFGKAYVMPVPVGNDDTKMFRGWYTNANGGGTQLTDELGNGLGVWGIAADTTVYAFWEDMILEYTETTYGGVEGYAVSAGARFGDYNVTKVSITRTYRGKPVLTIADNAFLRANACGSVREIEFPDTIQLVSAVDPFVGCVNLERITVRKVEGNPKVRYADEDGVLLDYGALDDQTGYATLAYVPASKTGRYTVSDKVRTIPGEVFKNRKISSIEISDTVTHIGAEAFSGCADLTAVIFQNPSAKQPALTFGARAFLNCAKLAEFSVPARATSLPLKRFTYVDTGTGTMRVEGSLGSVAGLADINDLFYGCGSLAKIEVNGSNDAYAAENGVLFNKSKSELLYFPAARAGAYSVPSGVGTIASGAFFGCGKIEYDIKNYYINDAGERVEGVNPVTGEPVETVITETGRTGITSVTIPAWVTEVGECAFYACPALTSVVFSGPGGQGTNIEKNAFRANEKLVTLNFASGSAAKTLGEGAFAECVLLNAVNLPASLTSVGSDAFRGCAELTELTFADSSATDASLTFGRDIVTDCAKLTALYLPKQAVNFPSYSGAPQCVVTVSPDNPNFNMSSDGVIFSPDGTEITSYPVNGESVFVTPEAVTKIGANAFRGRPISSITIGKNVTEIAEGAFLNCVGLQTVIFEKGGTEDLLIGENAFSGCLSLASVEIPARTKSIGMGAFEFVQTVSGRESLYSTGLESVSFEENSRLETIGARAFRGAHFTSVTVPKSVRTIGDSAFSATQLETVDFESGSVLETISSNAFAGNAFLNIGAEGDYILSNLREVNNIPKSVRYIRPFAFQSCEKLTTVTFEAGGTEDLVLGVPATWEGEITEDQLWIYFGQVFLDCSSLTELKLPARTKQLSFRMFAGCENLATVAFTTDGDTEESRLAELFQYAFIDSGITSITIPKSVANVVSGSEVEEAIGVGVFMNCAKLKSVIFEEGAASVCLSDSMFEGCAALETVELSDGVHDIVSGGNVIASAWGNGVFDGCAALKEFRVSEGNPQYASFDGVLYNKDFTEIVKCPAAKEGVFDIHENCESIRAGALEGCAGITELQVPGGFPFDVDLLKYFPGVKSIVFEGEDADYVFENGALYNRAKTELLFVAPDLTGDFEVIEGVTKLAEGLFKNSLVTNVKLPSTLQEIGAEAFMGSNLAGIRIPASLTTLGARAFQNCRALQTVAFEDGCLLGAIADDLFANCVLLTQLRIPAEVQSIAGYFLLGSGVTTVTFEENSKLTVLGEYAFAEDYDFEDTDNHKLASIELPASLTEIGENAFEYCWKLTGITIPANVTKIGAYAFRNCGNLTTVTFAEGSKLETIGQRAFSSSGITSFTVPASVKTIEGGGKGQLDSMGAFHSCLELRTVLFEEGSLLESIGACAFWDCSKLTNAELNGDLALPAGVSEIGVNAFSYTRIRSFTVPERVTVVSDQLFYRCTALERVTLHDGVTTIGAEAFWGCTGISEFAITKNVTSIGRNAFYGTAITFTVDPANVVYREDGNGGYTTRV